jgi:hypothetical protein
MVGKKEHPLKGRKQSPETIAKRRATLAKKRVAIAKGELLPKQRKSKKRIDTRTFEQLQRDVKEAVWCLEKAVAGTRRAIATGAASLTDVTDEETFMYMAMRYLQGGLR